MVEAGKLAAVGFGLDLTKRTLQSALKEKGLPWEHAKAFYGAALFSEFVPLPQEISKLSLELKVDGDIIMTGTPRGVGIINTGERFEGTVLAGTEKLVTGAWTAE